MKLIHLSDTHFGTTAGREYEPGKRIVAHILENHLDAVVVLTGDVTNNGGRSEFRVAHEVLEPLVEGCELFIVGPGNHDVEIAGSLGRVDRRHFRAFRSKLTKVKAGYPYCMTIDGVQLVMLNTSSAAGGIEDLARGEVGYKQRVELSKYLEMGEPRFRVVMGHHHLFERDVGLELVDADEVRAVCSSRCDLYLMGHKHQAAQWSDVYGIGRVIASHKVTARPDMKVDAFQYRLITLEADGGISAEWQTVERSE